MYRYRDGWTTVIRFWLGTLFVNEGLSLVTWKYITAYKLNGNNRFKPNNNSYWIGIFEIIQLIWAPCVVIFEEIGLLSEFTSALVWFRLVRFNGISTFVGYIISNRFYSYILNKGIVYTFCRWHFKRDWTHFFSLSLMVSLISI